MYDLPFFYLPTALPLASASARFSMSLSSTSSAIRPRFFGVERQAGVGAPDASPCTHRNRV
jgi:hypothetical protein